MKKKKEPDVADMVGGAFKMLGVISKGLSGGVADYERRKVAKDEVAGVRVSTAWTDDQGFETAICDEDGVHPVERYASREDAVFGHDKWLKFAKNKKNTKLTELGYDDLIDEEIKVIKRKEV